MKNDYKDQPTRKSTIKYVNKQSIWSFPKDIAPIRRAKERCPKCDETLTWKTTQIPVAEQKWAEVSGLWCSHCNTLFVTNGNDVKSLLKDNYLAKKYRFNGRENNEYTLGNHVTISRSGIPIVVQ